MKNTSGANPSGADDIAKISVRAIIRKAIDDSRSGVIASINKNKDAISKINDDIEKLLIARNALLRDNYDLTTNIVGARHFLYTDKTTLKNGFDEMHFESDRARAAVKQVRAIFFDDTQELYQKYNCIDIKFDDWGSYNRLNFVFSDKKREFTLSLPLTCDINSEAIQLTENCGGAMYISFWRYEGINDIVGKTLSIDEMRKTINDFMNAENLKDFNAKPAAKKTTLCDMLKFLVYDNPVLRAHVEFSYYDEDRLVYKRSTVTGTSAADI